MACNNTPRKQLSHDVKAITVRRISPSGKDYFIKVSQSTHYSMMEKQARLSQLNKQQTKKIRLLESQLEDERANHND